MSQDKFRRTLAAGEILFREGDHGQEAYVVESGSIEISTRRAGAQHVLARLGADDILGEMALVGDQHRNASAVATEPTTLAVITHDYLQDRLSHADPMLRHLLRVTTSRYRDSLQRAHGEAAPAPAAAEAAPADAGNDDRTLALKRLRIEQDLERALDQGEFKLFYQPIVRLSDNSVAGFEALIRWFKPGVGRIPPGDFISVAEESGLIVKMGHWIIRTACEDINHLEAAQRQANPDRPPLFVTVNLSIRQFSDPILFDTINSTLAKEGLAANRVKLEVTESMVMSNMDAALALLKQCKSLGAKLAVDDFGTGYSSLAYLHKFPMDTLKLDRSFIQDMASNEASMKIVRAVAHLAGELGMDTVCEGVEQAEQVESCRKVGITYAQGFYYSPALPVDEAAVYLQAPVAVAAARKMFLK